MNTFKILESFFRTKEARIFIGRLQLHKINQQIHTEVKGEIIGETSKLKFESYLKSNRQF